MSTPSRDSNPAPLSVFEKISAESEKMRNVFASVEEGAMAEIVKTFKNISVPAFPQVSMPDFSSLGASPALYQPPTPEELNQFQSARVLMQSLAQTIKEWRAALPDTEEPIVIALLNGGFTMRVHRVAQVSFHGIRIDGTTDGNPYVVLAHQGTVQLLCTPMKKEVDRPSTTIGFVIDGKESQA